MIYFAQAANGLIKIGWTETVSDRVVSIAAQIGQSVALLSATTGGLPQEQELHARFAAYRVPPIDPFGSEWFLPVVELMSHIASLPPTRLLDLTARRAGCGQLKLAIDRLGLSQHEAARKIGIDQGSLSRWLNGNRLPDLQSAIRIEDVFGVPVRAWITELNTAADVAAE